jgi:hypothetical protein
MDEMPRLAAPGIPNYIDRGARSSLGAFLLDGAYPQAGKQ